MNEALAEYLKTEILDGSNQYNCGSCDQKRDAEKGLKITKLPYLLTIQLKRFDFDYEIMDRVKLSDRVEFPFEADFSEFVPESDESHDYELFSVMIHSGSASGGHYYRAFKNYGPAPKFGYFWRRKTFFNYDKAIFKISNFWARIFLKISKKMIKLSQSDQNF